MGKFLGKVMLQSLVRLFRVLQLRVLLVCSESFSDSPRTCAHLRAESRRGEFLVSTTNGQRGARREGRKIFQNAVMRSFFVCAPHQNKSLRVFHRVEIFS